MSNSPDITVLMTVYNGDKYLESAARSILNQTFRNFEFIIVDDASTDSTPKILRDLSEEDARVKVLTMTSNQKQAEASNKGLEIAAAPLIARMDADDLADPKRLEVQKKHLDQNHNLLIVGASIDQIDGEGEFIRTSYRPRDAEAMRWLTRIHMPFNHPTIMFRRFGPDREPFKYAPDLAVAADYEFCANIVRKGDAINLPDTLLKYRVHGSSITGKNWRNQLKVAKAVSSQFQEEDLPAELFDAMAPFRKCYYDLTLETQEQIHSIFSGFRKLIAYDGERNPSHRSWYRRMSSHFIFEGFRRVRLTKPEIGHAFLRHGMDFVAPLGMRGLELHRKLPNVLRSDNWF